MPPSRADHVTRHGGTRIIGRAERLGYRLDPYLLALVIALASMNLTCYVAMPAPL